MAMIRLARYEIKCDGCGTKISQGAFSDAVYEALADCAIYCRLCRDKGVTPTVGVSGTIVRMPDIKIDHGAPDDDSQMPQSTPELKLTPPIESLPVQKGDTLEVDDVKEEPTGPAPKAVQAAGGVLATVRANQAKISEEQAKKSGENSA